MTSVLSAPAAAERVVLWCLYLGASTAGDGTSSPRWQQDQQLLTVEVEDDDEAAAAVIERLMGAGLRIIPAPSGRDVEDAFLLLSKGKTA